jgi:hypothetical protein
LSVKRSVLTIAILLSPGIYAQEPDAEPPEAPVSESPEEPAAESSEELAAPETGSETTPEAVRSSQQDRPPESPEEPAVEEEAAAEPAVEEEAAADPSLQSQAVEGFRQLVRTVQQASTWLHKEYMGTRTEGQNYHARITASSLSDFAVDAEGNTVAGDADQMMLLRSRVRMNWQEQSANGLLVGLELDALAGPLGQFTWAVPDSPDERQRNQGMDLARDAVSMRKLSVGNATRDANWEVGLTTSNWGLGMVANDGSRDPLFGNSEFGDRVLRARYTLMPLGGENDTALPIYLTAALDQVVADDSAQIWDGQWANQAVLSAYMGRSRAFGTGLYAAFRHQRELEEKRVTNAGIADWFIQLPIPVAENTALILGLEAASIFGRTNRSTTYNAREGMWLASSGLALESRLMLLNHGTTLHLRTGWASSDANPDDEWSKDFSFDRNYGVGMVLFDEFMGAVEGATHALLSNPEYSGSPPDGVEAITTEGAFRKGSYIQGAHSWQADGILKGLTTKIGGMVARSNADITQPFYTFRAGGSSRSHHNQPTTSKAMGTELDWGLSYSRPFKATTVHMKVEGGHLWLSPDLAGDGPSRVDLVMMTSSLGF